MGMNVGISRPPEAKFQEPPALKRVCEAETMAIVYARMSGLQGSSISSLAPSLYPPGTEEWYWQKLLAAKPDADAAYATEGARQSLIDGAHARRARGGGGQGRAGRRTR